MDSAQSHYWFNRVFDCIEQGLDQNREIIPRLNNFLARGGKLDQKNVAGKTLYALAKEKRLQDVVRYIQDKAWVELEHNIWVDPEHLDLIRKQLQIIKAGEVGSRLIKRIGEGRHKVTITYNAEGESSTENDLINSSIKEVGSRSDITLGGSRNTLIGTTPVIIDSYLFTSLSHELIHAYHNSYGKRNDSQEFDPVWTTWEEFHTIVGYPSKKVRRDKPKITENAIRLEHGLPERGAHLGGSIENLRIVYPNFEERNPLSNMNIRVIHRDEWDVSCKKKGKAPSLIARVMSFAINFLQHRFPR